MEICRKLAGYSYGHADIVRRAMAKKKHDVMLKERESFVSGAQKNGVPEGIANDIFDEMISFASYAFNKSHAAAYAYLAYQTAYLKRHYFGSYMAALMSSVMSSTGKLAEYISLCKQKGLTIAKPDVNLSMKGFTYNGGIMYFGLLAIKNAGSGLADRIITERQENGAYTGFQDFCERIEGRELNKKALENMIKAGAFDNLDLNRRQMLDSFEHILTTVSESSRGVMEGQLNFLESSDSVSYKMAIPFKPEYTAKKLLSLEKEATGMYLSGNPLSEYQYIYELMHLVSVKEVLERTEKKLLKDGDKVRILCTMQSRKLHQTKNGDKMCFTTVADDSGEIECVVFPDMFAVNGSKLREDNALLISGKISIKDDSVTIICGSIFDENEFSQLIGQMKLCIKTTSDTVGISEELKRISSENPGLTELCFYLTDLKKTVSPKTPLKVKIDAGIYGQLKKLYDVRKIGLIQ